MNPLLRSLGVELPILQAPMAGVSTPALAAAVSNAGGLGGIAVGTADATAAGSMIRAVRAMTDRPFVVNVFCNRPPRRDEQREAAWLAALAPVFTRYGATPPTRLETPYKSFVEDSDMLRVLVAERPAVVSFHLGLPSHGAIAALRGAHCALFATATHLGEARAIEDAGIDAVIAQGFEAGGHRGSFDEDVFDSALSTSVLTRLLVRECRIPVIAAGGIMDGAGIAAVMALGASAAQLGTAFVACPESSADDAHREGLVSAAGERTTMIRTLSGRPARSIANRFTALDLPVDGAPAYPVAYAAAKALAAAAKAHGETGFNAQWAGQGAPMARSLPAGELVAALEQERQLAIAELLSSAER